MAKWLSYTYKVNVKVKLLSHVRLFATPWTIAQQAPPSMGFSRQEHWSGLPFLSPGDLPNPGIEPMSAALAGGFFTTELPEKPKVSQTGWLKTREVYSLTVLKIRSPKWRGCQGHTPSETSGVGSFPPLPTPGGSRRSLAHGSIIPTSASIFMWLPPLCLFAFSPSYKDTGHIGSGSTLMPSS